ncbi:MAG: SCO family protein [Proteobacteria bacterium]|nr:SCO family protein [Pseudomonadota bacterium]MDA1332018.1 SCO family protein [Pseudomonadota bacterium]
MYFPIQGIAKVAVFMAFIGLIGGCGKPTGSQLQFNHTDITGADFARKFELTSHRGQSVRLTDFKGKVVVLFFGFMHCPDICPTTLSELNAVMERLGADAKHVQVLFVTVDPERDTLEKLGSYMEIFNPAFLGLSGTAAEIATVTQEFKVINQKIEGSMPDTYSLDHSAGTYVFDRDGQVRLFVPYGTDPDKLTSDILQLIKVPL